YLDMKNVKQWLHSTKTRCDSLKTHLEYMKMLYHDIPKIPETKKTLSSLNWQNPKIELSNNNNETVISKQTNCNNSLGEYSNIQCTFVNDNDENQEHESSLNSNLVNILSQINMQHKEEEKSENLNEQKERDFELSSITSQTYNLSQNTYVQSRSLSPIHQENMICEEHNHNWQYPYQKHLAEFSTELIQNAANAKKSFEQLILDNQNEYLLQELSSVRDDSKFNISGSVKDGSIDKSKICAKSEKKEKAVSSTLSSKKGSLCKLDDTISLKFKRRRKKVHSSNSRSTVTTRDTNFVGRKDTKKRKQKNNVNNRHTLKSQQTSNEVVEIYHNTAAKCGSTSAIPSKHSKLDHHMNYINILKSSAVNKRQTITVKPKCEDNSCHIRNIDVNSQQNYSQRQQEFKQKTEGRSTNTNDLNYTLEVSNAAPLCAMEKCYSHHCQSAIMQAPYCDPIVTHNYEMPTLASKLKRSNRSYFGRFNFQNIPFVVGTSVTPSHNLGLNIQQVLSIMKNRQSAGSGITPVLIRKISRGMKPVSILMEQINNQQSKLSHVNSRMTNIHMQKENLFMNKCEQLENENVFLKYDRKEDTRSENLLNTLNTTQLHAIDNKMLKLFASQQNVNSEMDTSNIQFKTYQVNICGKDVCNTSSVNQSQNSKGIREVLISLHDQFEEMNIKYEKLQAKIKECSNKGLEEEILNLEKELSAKEDEINAVVNLYKEVMALKHQMRVLQEKNGYICISTEIPLGSNKLCSSVPFTSTKSCGSSFQQRFCHRRGNSVITTREPTSLRLAGLLRQIQTFQKQLKLTSW
ncbi:hypothetical protein WH47_06798, partial [Habropoda laboriosa]